jgi:hypothetical protein
MEGRYGSIVLFIIYVVACLLGNYSVESYVIVILFEKLSTLLTLAY